MYCVGCGRAIETAASICPQCGRAVPQGVPVVPPTPGFEFQLDRYAAKVRVLGILWLVYGGIALVFGFMGMAFAHAFFSGNFGPWAEHNNIPMWIFPAAIHFGWLLLSMRVVLCAVAGWGLLERTQWGRIVAIIAAILNLIHPGAGHCHPGHSSRLSQFHALRADVKKAGLRFQGSANRAHTHLYLIAHP
jgi:hypothetical protein